MTDSGIALCEVRHTERVWKKKKSRLSKHSLPCTFLTQGQTLAPITGTACALHSPAAVSEGQHRAHRGCCPQQKGTSVGSPSQSRGARARPCLASCAHRGACSHCSCLVSAAPKRAGRAPPSRCCTCSSWAQTGPQP